MERQAQQIQADAEQRKREMEAKYPHRDDQMPRGPESLHRMQEMLHRNSDLMSEKKREQASEALHQMYLAAVAQQPPAVRLTGDLAQIIRQRAGRTSRKGGF
jgi:predicted phage gp36 major capsid-like protein